MVLSLTQLTRWPAQLTRHSRRLAFHRLLRKSGGFSSAHHSTSGLLRFLRRWVLTPPPKASTIARVVHPDHSDGPAAAVHVGDTAADVIAARRTTFDVQARFGDSAPDKTQRRRS